MVAQLEQVKAEHVALQHAGEKSHGAVGHLREQLKEVRFLGGTAPEVPEHISICWRTPSRAALTPLCGGRGH